MEMNIHTIILTGHFNNLKLGTQEHSFVTDRKINRKAYYGLWVAHSYSKFIELFPKLPIIYVQFAIGMLIIQDISTKRFTTLKGKSC